MSEKLPNHHASESLQANTVDDIALRSLVRLIREDKQRRNEGLDVDITLHAANEPKGHRKFSAQVDSVTYHEQEDFDDYGYKPAFFYDIDEFDQYGTALYDKEDYERTEFDNSARKFEVFPLQKEVFEKYPFLAELPQNIAVMGGMARSIAREVVAGDHEPIRDIDLVNILTSNGDSLNSPKVLDELSRKFMSDDYLNGHGIESTMLSEYFESRDFTVNEVLIMNGALVMSNFAYNDLQENIIRPTYFQAPNLEDVTDSRTTIRALTMLATLMESTESCPTLEDMKISEYFVRDFDAAVGMNKVMSRGAEVACRYTALLAEYGILYSGYANKPKEAAEYFGSQCYPYGFYYNLNTDERVGDVREKPNSFYSPGRVQYYSSNPDIRAALEEYSDDLHSERYTGQYTPEEIEEINERIYQNLNRP